MIPIAQWHLSQAGAERMKRFASSSTVSGVRAIYASRETKAIEAAKILGASTGASVAIKDGLEEMDRSATGFLPPPEFERTADEFFATPERSVRGWEPAADAQGRIVRAVDQILEAQPPANLAIVTHGGVGTLLLSRYLRVPISRKLDQPSQGHFWAFDLPSRSVLHPWRPLD
jgi:broad specificity phosphatase PhoE